MASGITFDSIRYDRFLAKLSIRCRSPKAISVMNERAHALQDNASQFELSTGKLKNSFWMENVKYTIIVLVLVAVVGIALYLIFRPSGAGFVYFSTPSNNGTSKEEN